MRHYLQTFFSLNSYVYKVRLSMIKGEFVFFPFFPPFPSYIPNVQMRKNYWQSHELGFCTRFSSRKLIIWSFESAVLIWAVPTVQRCLFHSTKCETFNMYLRKHKQSLTRVRKACLYKLLMKKCIINRNKIHWCYFIFPLQTSINSHPYKNCLEEEKNACSKMSIIKIPPPAMEMWLKGQC